jgi:hypothetical protein
MPKISLRNRDDGLNAGSSRVPRALLHRLIPIRDEPIVGTQRNAIFDFRPTPATEELVTGPAGRA